MPASQPLKDSEESMMPTPRFEALKDMTNSFCRSSSVLDTSIDSATEQKPKQRRPNLLAQRALRLGGSSV
jgi:hypothetical protein